MLPIIIITKLFVCTISGLCGVFFPIYASSMRSTTVDDPELGKYIIICGIIGISIGYIVCNVIETCVNLMLFLLNIC